MGRRKKDRRGRAGRKPPPSPPPRKRPSTWAIVLVLASVVAALAIVGGVVAAVRQANAPVPTATPSTLAARIDGIPCNNDDATYHEHAFLAMIVQGKDVPVPANIGIRDNTCVYWLHTHDNSGEIHLEAPISRPFTLGNFFDIWGQPLSRSQLLGHPIGPGQSMRIFVNFKPYAGDPRSITLKRHTRITIEIGPPFNPPVNFDFQGD